MNKEKIYTHRLSLRRMEGQSYIWGVKVRLTDLSPIVRIGTMKCKLVLSWAFLEILGGKRHLSIGVETLESRIANIYIYIIINKIITTVKGKISNKPKISLIFLYIRLDDLVMCIYYFACTRNLFFS